MFYFSAPTTVHDSTRMARSSVVLRPAPSTPMQSSSVKRPSGALRHQVLDDDAHYILRARLGLACDACGSMCPATAGAQHRVSRSCWHSLWTGAFRCSDPRPRVTTVLANRERRATPTWMATSTSGYTLTSPSTWSRPAETSTEMASWTLGRTDADQVYFVRPSSSRARTTSRTD